MKAVAAVARDAARLAPDDHAGRRAVEARLAVLSARLAREERAAIADDSDELDSVFPTLLPLREKVARKGRMRGVGAT